MPRGFGCPSCGVAIAADIEVSKNSCWPSEARAASSAPLVTRTICEITARSASVKPSGSATQLPQAQSNNPKQMSALTSVPPADVDGHRRWKWNRRLVDREEKFDEIDQIFSLRREDGVAGLGVSDEAGGEKLSQGVRGAVVKIGSGGGEAEQRRWVKAHGS